MNLLNEIPPGASVTVTLKNGTKFTGEESTHSDLAKDGVLRLERSAGRGEIEVFYTTADQLACFTVICEES